MYAFTRTSSCRSRTTRSSTARARSSRKMPGDEWQKFANLRLLFSYMWALPGKKLLFMGGEFGQWSEWNHDASLDWHLLAEPAHGQARAPRRLAQSPLQDRAGAAPPRRRGERLRVDRREQRRGERARLRAARRRRARRRRRRAQLHARAARRTTASASRGSGRWREAFNSDAIEFGGSGLGNLGRVSTVRSRGTGGGTRSASRCRLSGPCFSSPRDDLRRVI